MNEEWQSNPMLVQLVRRLQDTQSFLRMAAIELRRITERAPDIEVELRHVAQQLEAEAADCVALLPDCGTANRTDPGPSPGSLNATSS